MALSLVFSAKKDSPSCWELIREYQKLQQGEQITIFLFDSKNSSELFFSNYFLD